MKQNSFVYAIVFALILQGVSPILAMNIGAAASSAQQYSNSAQGQASSDTYNSNQALDQLKSSVPEVQAAFNALKSKAQDWMNFISANKDDGWSTCESDFFANLSSKYFIKSGSSEVLYFTPEMDAFVSAYESAVKKLNKVYQTLGFTINTKSITDASNDTLCYLNAINGSKSTNPNHGVNLPEGYTCPVKSGYSDGSVNAFESCLKAAGDASCNTHPCEEELEAYISDFQGLQSANVKLYDAFLSEMPYTTTATPGTASVPANLIKCILPTKCQSCPQTENNPTGSGCCFEMTTLSGNFSTTLQKFLAYAGEVSNNIATLLPEANSYKTSLTNLQNEFVSLNNEIKVYLSHQKDLVDVCNADIKAHEELVKVIDFAVGFVVGMVLIEVTGGVAGAAFGYMMQALLMIPDDGVSNVVNKFNYDIASSIADAADPGTTS